MSGINRSAGLLAPGFLPATYSMRSSPPRLLRRPTDGSPLSPAALEEEEERHIAWPRSNRVAPPVGCSMLRRNDVAAVIYRQTCALVQHQLTGSLLASWVTHMKDGRALEAFGMRWIFGDLGGLWTSMWVRRPSATGCCKARLHKPHAPCCRSWAAGPCVTTPCLRFDVGRSFTRPTVRQPSGT